MVNITEFGGSSSTDQNIVGAGSSSSDVDVDEGVQMDQASIERPLASPVRLNVIRYGVTRTLQFRRIGSMLTRTTPASHPSWQSLAQSIFNFWQTDVSASANANPVWRAFCGERIFQRPESEVTPAYCWPGGVPIFAKFQSETAPGLPFENLSWHYYEYDNVKDDIDTMIVVEPFMVVPDA